MKKLINKWFRFRISLVFLVCMLAFIGLAARAYQLQVLQNGKYTKMAVNQRLKRVQLAVERGFIYDSNFEMLAVSIGVDSVFANPKKIKDHKDAAEKLSEILNLNKRDVLKKLSNKKPSFVWLKRKVTFDETKKILISNLEGVSMVRESERYYPNANLASHILGFEGLDSKGLEGLELKYDSFIKGEEKFLISEKDALGKTVSLNDSDTKFKEGYDLLLTIDKNIQFITETELKKAVAEYDAKSAVAIVQEPFTGKVLAMASYPDYNPNRFSKFKADSIRNRAICDNFDPGSTFKPFVVAAALEAKAVVKDDIFFCENGVYYVDGVPLNDTKKHSWLSLKNIIKLSSNIGTIKAAEKLGKKELYNYLKKFNFGSKTGIDLCGESSGLMRNYKNWRNVDFSTIAFGQGISTTAIQLVNAFSSFANGGRVMKPYIVERIMKKDKTLVKEFTPVIKEQAISGETAKIITGFLTSVVNEGGTGTRAALENYIVAGKTGTAQKVDFENKTYSQEKYIASFIGYAPAGNPVVTVGIFIDEPKGSKYGGVVAAPAFKNIVEQILNLKGVAPEQLAAYEITNGKSRPHKNGWLSSVKKNIKFVKLAGEKIVMPDLSGLSLRQIIDSFNEIDLNVNIKGSGRVVEQLPLPGEIINKGKAVFIKCASF